MRHFTYLLAACLLALPFQGSAQKVYNLQSLLEQAVVNNSEIKKAALQQTESNYKVRETVAQGLPQLSGKIDYTRMGIAGINIPAGFAAELPQDILPLLMQLKNLKALHMISSNVTLSELVYSKQYWTGIKQAKAARGLYDILANKTKDEVVYDVATVYYQLLNNYSSLETLNGIIQNLEKIENVLELQYQNNLAKSTDVGRVKVQIANLKTNRQSLQDAIEIRKRILQILCGLPLDTHLLVDTANNTVDHIQKPVIPQFSVNQLPAYQIMKKQQELAKLKIKADQAKYYPNLAIFGRYNYQTYSAQLSLSGMSPSTSFGFEANIPIFSSGERHSKVMQSKLELKEMDEDFSTNTQQLGTNYENAANALASAWKGLQDQKENKALAKQVYDQVKLSFKEGMASLTDLLSVESSLLDAENLYNQQLLKYRIASLDMKNATGTILSIVHEK
ncbi:MAG: TolC family protein [Bacteroidales bacterium]|nr:TolC family protein [Bacteroidales bacterium]